MHGTALEHRVAQGLIQDLICSNFLVVPKGYAGSRCETLVCLFASEPCRSPCRSPLLSRLQPIWAALSTKQPLHLVT